MNEDHKVNPKSKPELGKTQPRLTVGVENGHEEDKPTQQRGWVANQERKPKRTSAMMTTSGKAPRRMAVAGRGQEKDESDRSAKMKIVIDLTGSYEVTEIICLSDIEED